MKRAKWVADFLSCDAEALDEAVGAPESAGLLIGAGRVRRLVPDILADFVLHSACVRAGARTGYAEKIMAAAPEAFTPRILANLGELEAEPKTKGRRCERRPGWRLRRVETRLNGRAGSDSSSWTAPWFNSSPRLRWNGRHPDTRSTAGPACCRLEDPVAPSRPRSTSRPSARRDMSRQSAATHGACSRTYGARRHYLAAAALTDDRDRSERYRRAARAIS
jgi:hypothetical protein